LRSTAAKSSEVRVNPDEAVDLIRAMSSLKNIRIVGLMTMGPFAGDPEDQDPISRNEKNLRCPEAMDLPGVEMKYLSMGMSNSYKVALEKEPIWFESEQSCLGEESDK